MKVEEQQNYVSKRVHRLLEPKCNSSSNNNNNNLSVSIESEEEKNLQLNELIDFNQHSQSELEIQKDIAFERLPNVMTSVENIDESENRDENESIDESENTDENINGSENRDENESVDESENTVENININESENENVNMVFENDQQKKNYVLLALMGFIRWCYFHV